MEFLQRGPWCCEKGEAQGKQVCDDCLAIEKLLIDPRDCQHKWDGEPYEDGKGLWTATCSKCGKWAINDSLEKDW